MILPLEERLPALLAESAGMSMRSSRKPSRPVVRRLASRQRIIASSQRSSLSRAAAASVPISSRALSSP